EAEVSESLLVRSRVEETPKRTGTTFRIGAAFNLAHAPLPVYGTVMFPFHLEPSPFLFGVRFGLGTSFHLPIPQARLFVEADLDFPIAGGTGTPSAFNAQTLVLAAGILIHL